MYDIYTHILSRRRKSVNHKPSEGVLYKPKADNQVTLQATNGEFCCVSSHFQTLLVMIFTTIVQFPGEEEGDDYSRKLEEDSTPAVPATENRYQLVTQIPAGSREREVRLFVKVENMQQTPATTKLAMELSPVPVAMFGSHVERNRTRNNRGFRDEYKVCCLIFILPTLEMGR